ncbi:MAG: ABC transporter substrate-binding protein [Spirochaetaceae bacterium]|jgi:ABC-type branched-subunit amino acid transport system substrate-binding protein|nr:ABC transporter substrate-binding protein [Spirochaetaceae bacterium]
MKRTVFITVILLSLLTVFGFVSCQRGGGAQQGSEIHIGAAICSEGAYALVGVPYGNFYKAYVDYINQAPEYKDILKGRTIRATIYDDKGDGAAGKTYIEKLINDDNVFSLVGILGTWNVVAAKYELETSGIPAVYFGTGTSAQMFEPASGSQRYMMGVQPLYKTEGRLMYLRAITYFQNVKSIGVVFSTADDGLSLKAGIEAQSALDNRPEGVKPAIVYQPIGSSDAASIGPQITAVQNCDVIIAAGNQAYFKAIYAAAYANSIARPRPMITTYVNISPTNIPTEAINSGAAEIYGAAWVVYYEKPGSSAEADRRLKDYAEYCKIVDWDTRYIPASEKEAYKVNAYSMSSYIAVRTFLVGIERLNASGKPLNAENFLEAMESQRVPVAISGGVNYAGGNRIGLDSLAFSKYQRPAPGRSAADGTFVEADPMASIDELIAKLGR